MDNATYQRVTDRILAQLEAGTAPWHQSWAAEAGAIRPLRAEGIPYRGVNVIQLWAAAQVRGFASPYWLSYKRAAELGGHVKRGAKSELVFFVGSIARTEETPNGEEAERTIQFLRCYPVFSANECEDLPAHFYAVPERKSLAEGERNEAAEAWIAGTGAKVLYGGGRCFYRPSTD